MQKQDRRSKRTHAALLKSFVQIMLAEGYGAVTVERVCTRADVGRSTFYLHFAGKEALLRESLAGPSSQLAVLVDGEAGAEMLRPLLEHFHQQRRKNWVGLAHPLRDIWAKCLGELIEPRLVARVRALRARPILPLPMIARQIAEAQLSLIAMWLGKHPATPALTIAEALIGATKGMMAALLRCDQSALTGKRAE